MYFVHEKNFKLKMANFFFLQIYLFSLVDIVTTSTDTVFIRDKSGLTIIYNDKSCGICVCQNTYKVYLYKRNVRNQKYSQKLLTF